MIGYDAAVKRMKAAEGELEQFHGLFSDHDAPCTSFVQAQAIWKMLKDREAALACKLKELEHTPQYELAKQRDEALTELGDLQETNFWNPHVMALFDELYGLVDTLAPDKVIRETLIQRRTDLGKLSANPGKAPKQAPSHE